MAVNICSIWEGIVIGAVGGAFAGLTVWGIGQLQRKWLERLHKYRIYSWLKTNLPDKDANEYRSTRAIASWNNLNEDRVRYICSIHDDIFLSTGEKEDMWSIYGVGRKKKKQKPNPYRADG